MTSKLFPCILCFLTMALASCSGLGGYSGPLKAPSKSATKAKGPLFNQTMEMIGGDQSYYAKDGCKRARVESVRSLPPTTGGTNTYNKKGQLVSGAFRELWTVDRCGRKVRYEVTYKTSKKGTDILMDVH